MFRGGGGSKVTAAGLERLLEAEARRATAHQLVDDVQRIAGQDFDVVRADCEGDRLVSAHEPIRQP